MLQAANDFLVVRYDQLGSWNSDKPDDLTLWQVPRFVEEVEQVRQALGLGAGSTCWASPGAPSSPSSTPCITRSTCAA